MAGPRITRLGDPANPYTQKRTPTSAPTPAQQVKNRAVSQQIASTPAKRTPVARTSNPKVQPIMTQLQGGYATRQNARIDGAVEGKKPK